jgi:hypothetical protein
MWSHLGELGVLRDMAPRRDERCGGRFRRATPDTEPHIPETEEVGLSTLGEAFIDALRNDERFRDIIADPFGEEGSSAA